MDIEIRNNEIRRTYERMKLQHLERGYIIKYLTEVFKISQSQVYNIIREK